MKKIILYLLLITPFILMGQTKKIPEKVELKEDYGHFGKKSTISFSKRLQNYPFNKTTQIKLVSFNYHGGQIKDTVYYNPIMPKLNYAICRLPFTEIKSLNYLFVDSLTNILFNYGYIKEPIVSDDIKCYEPRNGILFINKDGKVFEFIEICFECKKIVYSYNDKANAEDFESPKFKLLRIFFKKAGLEYGVVKTFEGKEIVNWDEN